MHLEIFKMSTAKTFSRVALMVEHCPRGRRNWFDSNPGSKTLWHLAYAEYGVVAAQRIVNPTAQVRFLVFGLRYLQRVITF